MQMRRQHATPPRILENPAMSIRGVASGGHILSGGREFCARISTGGSPARPTMDLAWHKPSLCGRDSSGAQIRWCHLTRSPKMPCPFPITTLQGWRPRHSETPENKTLMGGGAGMWAEGSRDRASRKGRRCPLFWSPGESLPTQGLCFLIWKMKGC